MRKPFSWGNAAEQWFARVGGYDINYFKIRWCPGQEPQDKATQASTAGNFPGVALICLIRTWRIPAMRRQLPRVSQLRNGIITSRISAPTRRSLAMRSGTRPHLAMCAKPVALTSPPLTWYSRMGTLLRYPVEQLPLQRCGDSVGSGTVGGTSTQVRNEDRLDVLEAMADGRNPMTSAGDPKYRLATPNSLVYRIVNQRRDSPDYHPSVPWAYSTRVRISIAHQIRISS